MTPVSLGRVAAAGAAVVALASTVAICATYSRLSHTWDEGTHVAAGLELLQFGRYTLHTENPPLSRVPLAVVQTGCKRKYSHSLPTLRYFTGPST
jgi:hypothetical protein